MAIFLNDMLCTWVLVSMKLFVDANCTLVAIVITIFRMRVLVIPAKDDSVQGLPGRHVAVFMNLCPVVPVPRRHFGDLFGLVLFGDGSSLFHLDGPDFLQVIL